ncbi:MAG: amidohydrolase, partial [Sphingomonas sp.]|nr:amidohydrolase [Sphingomonas sp.]
MTRLRFLIALLGLACASAAHAQSLAIVHAKAWTGASESRVDDATIVVQNGKVVSIAAGAAAPAGLEV